MDEIQYRSLCRKYGDYSSWAIWNHEDEADPTIIESHIDELNANHVFIAYNCSRTEGFIGHGPWANFRGWKHGRKLKYVHAMIRLFAGLTLPICSRALIRKLAAIRPSTPQIQAERYYRID